MRAQHRLSNAPLCHVTLFQNVAHTTFAKHTCFFQLTLLAPVVTCLDCNLPCRKLCTRHSNSWLIISCLIPLCGLNASVVSPFRNTSIVGGRGRGGNGGCGQKHRRHRVFEAGWRPRNTANTVGSLVRLATMEKLPGLSNLGTSLKHIDFAPGSANPPHTHPRATEVVFILDGRFNSGFGTNADQLFAKTISKSDIFAIPRGLVQFQMNPSPDAPPAIVTAFNSQF